MNDAIDTAARDADRDPAAVRRLYNVFGSFAHRRPHWRPASRALPRTGPNSWLSWLSTRE